MASLSHLSSWHSDWQGLRVAVIGLGVTGFSAADTLAELGCEVAVFAEKAEDDYLDILDVLGVDHFTGAAAADLPQALIEFKPQLIVTSPGVKPNSPIIVWAAETGIEVWVDIDLAWRLRDKTDRIAKWLMITGTNGKTTTAQLTTDMLIAGGYRAAACGNIGTPILDCIREPEGFDFLVIEVSSFQLHYLGPVSPLASVLLNIDQDHIDWHGSFDAYRAAKAKVFEGTEVAAIFNTGDAKTMHLLEEANVVEGARAIGFGVATPRISEVGFAEDILCDRAFIENRADAALELATLDDISKIGVLTPHLMANVAAAAALARACGIEPESIKRAIADFKLDKHRMELIAVRNSITWIDDSKATNPHATAASLASFDRVVWVVGGLLKGVDFAPLVERYAKKLSGAVIIGLDRGLILEAFATHAPAVPLVEIDVEENSMVMSHAVAAAANLAQPGDTVLLAPASASMDQFKDYSDRGNQFAQAVHDLPGEN
jgi:UDP-N-acetylmuramoylalanine--D-glutamate ligase